MSLFDQRRERRDVPQFSLCRADSSVLSFSNPLRICGLLIDSDDTMDSLGNRQDTSLTRSDLVFTPSTGLRSRMNTAWQCVADKALGGLCIPSWTQKNLHGVPLRGDGPVEIDPDFFDFDGRLIHTPGVVAGFQIRSRALFQFRSVILDPAEDRAMSHTRSAFPHHGFEVTIAERVTEGPANTEKKHVSLEVGPCERMLMTHEGNCSAPLQRPKRFPSHPHSCNTTIQEANVPMIAPGTATARYNPSPAGRNSHASPASRVAPVKLPSTRRKSSHAWLGSLA